MKGVQRLRFDRKFVVATVLGLGALAYWRYEVISVTHYDPFAVATAEKARGRIDNVLAHIPPQCYTRTDGVSNPCWTCHTDKNGRNATEDWELQARYQLNAQGRINHWTNLFEDRRPAMAKISDAAALRYIHEDNYTALLNALSYVDTSSLPWKPDIDLRKGFDAQGFAVDGSGWRAFRYKPFPGTFWPTNGSTNEVFIRLPEEFRKDASGHFSTAIYKANLAIVEAAVAVPDTAPDEHFDYPVEPIDETAAQMDFNGDGEVAKLATILHRLPQHYAGAANTRSVVRYDYPIGTEFLHTVRYVDPDGPGLRSIRLKELRYSRKLFRLDDAAMRLRVEEDAREQKTGGWPYFGGDAFSGLFNEYGWRLQGYIEDAKGRLRLQTREEQVYCMGCHGGIGITVDSSFSLPRKVPGAWGWGQQDIAGVKDVPQWGSDEPETLEYFHRVGGGDEFRANDEIRSRFFPVGQLDETSVLRAAPGGPEDIRTLIFPSRTRGLELDKAYMSLVAEQSYKFGRDAPIAVDQNVYRKIEDKETGLQARGRVWRDGRIWLNWSAKEFKTSSEADLGSR